jgi:hypothetical protein
MEMWIPHPTVARRTSCKNSPAGLTPLLAHTSALTLDEHKRATSSGRRSKAPGLLSLNVEREALGYDSDDSVPSPALGGGAYTSPHGGQEYFNPAFSHSASTSPSSSKPSSPTQQTVTFSTCPSCDTIEHHFFQESRICGRCGYKRYLVSRAFTRCASSRIC